MFDLLNHSDIQALREVMLYLRNILCATLSILESKGVFTNEEFERVLIQITQVLDQDDAVLKEQIEREQWEKKPEDIWVIALLTGDKELLKKAEQAIKDKKKREEEDGK